MADGHIGGSSHEHAVPASRRPNWRNIDCHRCTIAHWRALDVLIFGTMLVIFGFEQGRAHRERLARRTPATAEVPEAGSRGCHAAHYCADTVSPVSAVSETALIVILATAC